MEIGAILSLKPVGFIELPPTRKSVERKMFKIPFGQPNFGHVRNPFPHTYRPICPPTMAIMEQRETPMSFYQLLGIPEDGTLPDIKQAYRQLARKYHPDVCPPDQAEEYTRRFIEVQEAYETLSDPRRKNMYDSHLARRVHPGVSARKCWDYPQEELENENWRSRWEAQLSNLKQRARSKDAEQPLSWGARMRQKKRSD